MTLLIAWFLIAGFDLHAVWYFITFVVWLVHVAYHSDGSSG